jgi:AraC-like DNA-binding protein
MNADIQLLFDSPLVRVFDYECRACRGTVSGPEWVNSFNIDFTRQGNFEYRIGNTTHDIHNGVLLLENAYTEHVVAHDHHIQDRCTSLAVSESLLHETATGESIAQVLSSRAPGDTDFRFPANALPTTPAMELLHAMIYQSALSKASGRTLKIDVLIIQLLHQIHHAFSDRTAFLQPQPIGGRLKDRHLETVERGKAYILGNFQKEMSLADIAKHAFVSPFHFARIFKQFTSHSPYHFMLQVRLSHAALMLRNTSHSVTEICFESGFNTLEHFISSFVRQFKMSPSRFRRS